MGVNVETKTSQTKTLQTKTPQTKTPQTKTPQTKTPLTKTPLTKTPQTKTPQKKPSPCDNTVTLILRAEEMSELVKARSSLLDVVHGDILECANAPALAHFLTSGSRQKLRSMEKEAQAYICVDNRLHTLAIHGSAAAVNKG
jgi:hypothetical protein